MSTAQPPELSPADRLASVVSPLAGVNPRSLDAIMAEDVAKLSEGEFDQVIEHMRGLRKTWAENESKKASAEGAAPKAKAGAKPKVARGTVKIDLSELF